MYLWIKYQVIPFKLIIDISHVYWRRHYVQYTKGVVHFESFDYKLDIYYSYLQWEAECKISTIVPKSWESASVSWHQSHGDKVQYIIVGKQKATLSILTHCLSTLHFVWGPGGQTWFSIVFVSWRNVKIGVVIYIFRTMWNTVSHRYG